MPTTQRPQVTLPDTSAISCNINPGGISCDVFPITATIVVLAFAGCADDSRDPLSPRFSNQPVPFTGARCELAIQPATPIGPGVVRQLDIGECRFTHLGLTQYLSDKIIDFAAGTQALQITYTAANGDQLYATGNGTNQLVHPGSSRSVRTLRSSEVRGGL
jgi:hypothetical protein